MGIWMDASNRDCVAMQDLTPKTARKLIYATMVLMVFIGPSLPNIYRAFDYKQRYSTAKALFDERCKNARQEVHKIISDVEGVLLLNVRADDKLENEANQKWPDAGLPNERSGEEYLASFLMWEHHGDKRNPRGGLNFAHSDQPGYGYVDTKLDDGSVYRYVLAEPENQDSSKLLRTKLTQAPARYAISFTNIQDDIDRQSWVAGTTVSITDTRTGELLAKRTWYSFEPGLGSRAGGRQPWRFALSCPETRGSEKRTPTRFFVDQVLIPMKERMPK